MYTSGTTGNPKGVMLTHGNLLSNVFASLAVARRSTRDDVHLNWLPFSHIYARTMDIIRPLAVGPCCAWPNRRRPWWPISRRCSRRTCSGVPRFYEKVLAARAHDDPEGSANACARSSARASTGSAPAELRCRSPSPRPIKSAGLLLLQGYGLTESSPVITFNRTDCHKIDTVGLPLPGVEVRIAADGEVLTRGPHVMNGYWNNPQADAARPSPTAGCTPATWAARRRRFSDDHRPQEGTAGAVQRQESGAQPHRGLAAGRSVHRPGRGLRRGPNFLTALVVPHWDNLAHAMSANEAELSARDAKVQAFLEARIKHALADQAAWEQVQKVVVLAEPFSVARDEMTVSLKLRRNVIVDRHRTELETLYRD